MKLNVAQIYTWHIAFSFISSRGFSLLKNKICGLEDQDGSMVGWLYCFPNHKSDYSLYIWVKKKNFQLACSPHSPWPPIFAFIRLASLVGPKWLVLTPDLLSASPATPLCLPIPLLGCDEA
jgi:hypothetical protein